MKTTLDKKKTGKLEVSNKQAKPIPLYRTMNHRKLGFNCELHITDECLAKIRNMCDLIHDKEWCGYVLYTENQSEINENYKIEVVDILPMGIGTQVYTEFTNAARLSGYLFDNYLGDEEIRHGFIHSHHNMNAYFSDTDRNQLLEGSTTHNRFLSLIVNNSKQYCAKMGYVIERIISYTDSIPDKNGEYVQKRESLRSEKMIELLSFDIIYGDHNKPKDNPMFYHLEHMEVYTESQHQWYDQPNPNSNQVVGNYHVAEKRTVDVSGEQWELQSQFNENNEPLVLSDFQEFNDLDLVIQQQIYLIEDGIMTIDQLDESAVQAILNTFGEKAALLD